MRRMILYSIAGVALVLGLVVAGRVPAEQRISYTEEGSFQEECIAEGGCSDEEIEELHETYDEECFGEGSCSMEEVVETAGTPEAVNAMLDEFASRGLKVSSEHRCNEQCIQEHRCVFTSCTGFVQKCCGTGKKRGWCVGYWTCPPDEPLQ